MTRTMTCLLATAITVTGCGRPSAPPTSEVRSNADQTPLTEAALELPEASFASWQAISDTNRNVTDVPVTWSENENVVWKANVAGRGHSSPIIVDNHVYLTTSDEEAETQSIIALDRSTGDELWTTVAHRGGFARMHKKNTHASSTPACDGQRIFAAFVNGNALHVTACATDGDIAWQAEVGPFESEHGYGSSVVIWRGLAIVAGDSPGNGFVAALSRETGDLVWRTPRKGVGGHGSYSTPAIAEIGGRWQLVHSGYGRTVSYDPATGEPLWRCEGPSEVTANTVAIQDPHVFVSGGYPEKQILCIDATGTGDISDSHVRWRSDRNVTYVPSPTIVGDALYTLSDDGILAAIDMSDGQRLWQKRIGGNFSASPLVIDGTFYIPSESGELHVFGVQPKYESLAVNQLADGGGMASVAISDNQLFVRTSHQIYCIAQP